MPVCELKVERAADALPILADLPDGVTAYFELPIDADPAPQRVRVVQGHESLPHRPRNHARDRVPVDVDDFEDGIEQRAEALRQDRHCDALSLFQRYAEDVLIPGLSRAFNAAVDRNGQRNRLCRGRRVVVLLLQDLRVLTHSHAQARLRFAATDRWLNPKALAVSRVRGSLHLYLVIVPQIDSFQVELCRRALAQPERKDPREVREGADIEPVEMPRASGPGRIGHSNPVGSRL